MKQTYYAYFCNGINCIISITINTIFDIRSNQSTGFIIKYYFSIELDEDDLNYDRLLTHLKYFAKRIVNNNKQNINDSGFIKVISTTYPEAYGCAIKIGEYIRSNNNYDVNEDEIVYLTMHIQRVISVAREKKESKTLS